jgi:hypothetical protein
VQNINVTNMRSGTTIQLGAVRNPHVVSTDAAAGGTNYMYANNAVAVTAVSRETFVGAKPVATGFVRVTPEQLQNAHVIDQTPIPPTRSSYVAATARPARGIPPVAFSERPVVARLNPPMPVASHNVAHSVNALGAPGAGQTGASSPRANNVAPTRPPVRTYTNDDVARAPQYPNTDARSNVKTNANANAGANANAIERQNTNGNARPNTNARPPANDTAQQHPAVKFTPPTKAKDQDYDVHPPLNQHANTPPPAEHHEAQAPASHPAPAQHSSPPPPSHPKS